MTPTGLRRIALLAAMALWPLAASAQLIDEATAEDPGFLEGIIQNALGGEGREVRISGLEGALSADVRIAAIDVADEDGVWLSIRNVAMSWRRLALIRGRVEIDALTIGAVDLVRPPLAPPPAPPAITLEAEEAPAPPEPFALPELPVALNVGEVSVGRVDLGETVLGQAAALSLDGGARLAGGEGEARLQVLRLDGPAGLIDLNAGFVNETRRLTVFLNVEEAPGGIVATLANFPGAPSVDLDISGDAPISDFTAAINLATDGQTRLRGGMTLAEDTGAADADTPPVQTITAFLGGDIAPLFAPDYQEFFGTDVGLDAVVRLDPEAGTQIETLDVRAEALRLQGTVSLLPSGLPRLVDVTGQIAAADGDLVTLPVPGPLTEVRRVDLALDYDQSEGDAFLARVDVAELSQGDMGVGSAALALDGALRTTDAPFSVDEVVTALEATLEGISLGDPNLDNALAPPVTFQGNVAFDPEAATVAVRDLALQTGDVALTGTADVDDLGGATNVSASVDLTTGDLARFAPLAGQDLQGRFEGAVRANLSVGTGAIDLVVDGDGTGLAIGNPQVDPLLEGAAEIGLTAHRDTDGLELERLALTTDLVEVTGTGALSSRVAALDLDARLAETDFLAPQLSGPLDLTADVSGGGTDFAVAAALAGAAVEDILGAPATLSSDVTYDAGAGDLSLAGFDLQAGDLQVAGDADVRGLNDTPAVESALTLDTGDLTRLARLTGLPLAGRLAAEVEAALDTGAQSFDVRLDGAGQDLAIGNPQLDPLLAGRTELDIAAQGADGALQIERLTVTNPAVDIRGAGSASIDAADLTLSAALTQSDILVPHLSGPVQVDAEITGANNRFDIGLTAAGAAILEALGDSVRLDSDVAYDPNGASLDVAALSLTAGTLTATGSAQVRGLDTAPAIDAALDLDTGDLDRLAALAGLPLDGSLAAEIGGAFDSGTGGFDAQITGRGQDIAVGTAQVDQLLAGTTQIDLRAARADDVIELSEIDIQNPALTVTGTGRIAPEGGAVDIDARLAQLGLFVPQVSGPLTLTANAQGAGEAWTVALDAQGPAGLRANVAGDVAPTALDLAVQAGLESLGTFVPGLVGGLSLDGAVTGDGTDYFVDVEATSPTGLAASVDGRAWGPDGTADLGITAGVPLALAEAFIQPRRLSGTLNADLALAGAPGLEALSGAITIDGARFSDPGTRIVLENIALNFGLADAAAALDLSADLATGGQIRVDGPVTLSDPYPGQIAVVLDDLTLVDPRLYEIDLGGQITLDGPLAGGAAVQGRIDIAGAEIKIPTNFGSGGPILDIQHRDEAAGSRTTRQRAGVAAAEPAGTAEGGTGAPVAYPLDITVSAPQRVFIRGRGLDAEVGGSLDIGGTTARPIPAGRFELIRGRMALLGRQLEFTEAEVRLGGDLVPSLFMVATSQTAEIDARIEISGPANAPELAFSSSPELPEDEVLAQLFFGKSVQELTPLEVAQLVAAINTLTGGGGGLFGSLREGIGVDQLSVAQDEDGNTEVTAGRYLTDDIFTDVTVNAEGDTRIDLNYEISPSLRARTGFDNDGDARLGFTFERDY